jgi:hypothetical protein
MGYVFRAFQSTKCIHFYRKLGGARNKPKTVKEARILEKKSIVLYTNGRPC